MKYFAYGSNMDPGRMKERGINFSKREYAILEGWRLKFNKVVSRNLNEGYANIKKAKGCVVEGVLYTIQDEGIKKLDRFEGYPNHYKKLRVKVKPDDGGEEEAVTYIANSDKARECLRPSKKYLGHLLKGCDLLSKEYSKRLKRWKTLN